MAKQQSKLDKVVQLLIPPSLVILLTVTIYELFFGSGNFKLFIDIFDVYIITIFAIDLYYRWQELPHFFPFVKKYILDIIATIPFNFIFLGVEGLTLIAALRGVRLITRIARLSRYTRLLRLIRFGTRAPRFLRIRKQVKKAKPRKVQPHEKKMKGVLSFKVILLVTINSIMGTGIYFLTAAGAKHAGPASLVSWGLLSLVSVYIAMCFSELTAMFPKAGGVYEFAKQAYGRFWSFVIGWTTAIAGSVTIAMLLLGALQYLLPNNANLYIPIAWGLILVFNAVAYRGMKTSTFMLVGFALITLVTVLGLIIPGLFNIDPANFTPFFVFPTFAILITIFFIAETFFGWESAIFLAAETKNTTKVMPKALIYGTLVIAVLSFTLALSAMGVIPWNQYAESARPLSDIGGVLFGQVGGIIFTILVFTSIVGAVAAWTVTAPRLLMSIAEDKLFFVQFARIHPKNKSPYVSIAFQVLVLAALVWIGSGSYTTLLEMLIPLILFIYSAVLLSVVILRVKKPNLKRPYRVVFGRVGPVLVVAFMIFLLTMFILEGHDALHILKLSGSLVAFGLPAYFAIELFYDPKYVELRRNLTARVRHLFNLVPQPRPASRKMLRLVGDIKPKAVVIDSNSSMGSLATLVSKKQPKAKVHVVNLSKQQLEYLPASFAKHRSALGQLPKVKANVLLSHQDLGYVKIDAYLKKVHAALAKGGRFCFFIHSSFLNVPPNAIEIDKKKEILAAFKKAGLTAEYTQRKFFLGHDVFIYGKKK